MVLEIPSDHYTPVFKVEPWILGTTCLKRKRRPVWSAFNVVQLGRNYHGNEVVTLQNITQMPEDPSPFILSIISLVPPYSKNSTVTIVTGNKFLSLKKEKIHFAIHFLLQFSRNEILIFEEMQHDVQIETDIFDRSGILEPRTIYEMKLDLIQIQLGKRKASPVLLTDFPSVF